MSFIRTLFDKIVARFVSALFQEYDKRHLHPHRLLLEKAQRESADYAASNMPNAVVLKDQASVLEFAISRIEIEGNVLEFGVASGESIRRICGSISRPVHGFDSFEGLPEDWGGRHEGKGHYTTHGHLPSVPSNAVLHKGWFKDSLEKFCKNDNEDVSFLHIDCDLYSSTKTVFEYLGPRIRVGTVIVFDEYFNFASWKEHEFKAFQEFVSEYGVEYRYLCWAYQQAAVVVLSIDGDATAKLKSDV
jgi:predicted O-methyltransferase YrrM